MNSKTLQTLSTSIPLKDSLITSKGIQYICKRGKVDIGTFCNYKCYFCYYKSKLNQTTSLDTIKSRIYRLYELGCRDFDLSGGEPTIRRDFIDIIKYIKALNSDNKVSCLTNGSNPKIIKKAFEAGLMEILFSIHSYGDIHDEMTGIKGSYDKIIDSYWIAKELGIKCRINSTITNINYHLIDNVYFDLIQILKPQQVNFLPINYFENTEESIDYSVILKPIENFIDKFTNMQNSTKVDNLHKFENWECEVNVRYVPFCHLPNHIEYLKGYKQHIYDSGDWNICWYHYTPSTLENLNNMLRENRIRSYNKVDKCLKCKYFNECDGIEPQAKQDFRLIVN